MRPKTNRNTRRLAAVITMGLLALAPAAQAAGAITDRAYECAINRNGQNGWVPREIQFGFLENETKVKVRDTHTYSVKKKAIVTTLKSRANGKKSFRWMVALPSDANYLVNVSYRVEFDPKTRKGTIVAHVQGSSGRRNSGSLTCKDYAAAKLDQAEPNFGAAAKASENPRMKTEKSMQDDRWQRYCRSGTIFALHRKFCHTYPQEN